MEVWVDFDVYKNFTRYWLAETQKDSPCIFCKKFHATIRIEQNSSNYSFFTCISCMRKWEYDQIKKAEEHSKLVERRIMLEKYLFKGLVSLGILLTILSVPFCCKKMVDLRLYYEGNRYSILRNNFSEDKVYDIAKVDKWDGRLPRYNGNGREIIRIE